MGAQSPKLESVARSLRRLRRAVGVRSTTFAVRSEISLHRLVHIAKHGDIRESEAVRILEFVSEFGQDPEMVRAIRQFEDAVDAAIPSIWLVWPLNLR